MVWPGILSHMNRKGRCFMLRYDVFVSWFACMLLRICMFFCLAELSLQTLCAVWQTSLLQDNKYSQRHLLTQDPLLILSFDQKLPRQFLVYRSVDSDTGRPRAARRGLASRTTTVLPLTSLQYLSEKGGPSPDLDRHLRIWTAPSTRVRLYPFLAKLRRIYFFRIIFAESKILCWMRYT